MILNASGRCDIPAFFSTWFFNRVKAGFIDVRNPFYPKQVSRILIDKEHIELFVFCTKNPLPMLPRLDELKDYPLLFEVTITPYGKEIEPHVPPKGKIIEGFQTLSKKLGQDHVILRYDPIFLNPKYTVDYHIKQFEKLCQLLDGYTTHVIISWMDMKKNTKKNLNILQNIPFQKSDIELLAKKFYEIAKKHHMTIQTCAEEMDLKKYGFINESCLGKTIVQELLQTNKNYSENKNREHCHCVKSVDIGSYNTCPHFCKYCYANFKEEEVLSNYRLHDSTSSLLIGTLEEDDIVKVREK